MGNEVSGVYLIKYYEAFWDFLQTVGTYLAIAKMEINVSEGVFPVQKVAYEYGYTGSRMDMEVSVRDTERWRRLDDLDHWSQKVGFLPINQEGKEKIMRFVEDADRRRYLRDNVRRLMDKGELLSIADLMRKRYALEKKRREKK